MFIVLCLFVTSFFASLKGMSFDKDYAIEKNWIVDGPPGSKHEVIAITANECRIDGTLVAEIGILIQCRKLSGKGMIAGRMIGIQCRDECTFNGTIIKCSEQGTFNASNNIMTRLNKEIEYRVVPGCKWVDEK